MHDVAGDHREDQRRRDGEPDRASRAGANPPCNRDALADGRKLIGRGRERRQRPRPGGALVQSLKLALTALAAGKVLHRLGVSRLAAVVVALLFVTGFWSADVKGGALPKVDVKAEGGALPDVDLNSKEVVVGTQKTTVDVPKVETEKKEIDVPTVGVKDDGNN